MGKLGICTNTPTAGIHHISGDGFVSEDGPGGSSSSTPSGDGTRMVWHLIEATKEQQKLIEEKDEKIESISTTIEDLTKRLEELLVSEK